MAAAKSIVEDISNETKSFLKTFTTKYVETLVLDKLQASIEEALASALGENSDDPQQQTSTSESEPKLPEAPGENEDLKSPTDTTSEEKKEIGDSSTAPSVIGITLSGYATMKGNDDAEYTSYTLTGCNMSSFNATDNTPGSKLTLKYLRYSKLNSFNSAFQKQLKLEQFDVTNLVFPGKKAFGKMNPAFVETRAAALKSYFEQINSDSKLNQHPKFQEFFDLDEGEDADAMMILMKTIIAACNELGWSVPPMVDLLKCDGGEEVMEATLMYRFRQRSDLAQLGGVVKKTVQMGIAKAVGPQVLIVWKTVNSLRDTIQSKLDSVIQSKKAQIISSLKSILAQIIKIPAIQKKLLDPSTTPESQPGDATQESPIDLDQVPSWQEFWKKFEKKEAPWPKLVHEMNEEYWHKIFVDQRGEWEEVFKYNLAGQLSNYSAFKTIVSRHEHICRATAHLLQRAYTLCLEVLKLYDAKSTGNDQEIEAYIRKMGLELAQQMDKLKNEAQGHCHELSSLATSTIVDEASLVCSYIGDLMVGMVSKQCVDKRQYAKQLLTQMISDLLQGIQDATTVDACEIIQGELEKGLKSLTGALDFLPDMITQYFPFLPFATRLLEHVILYRVKQVTSAQRQQTEQKLAQRLTGNSE